MVLTSIKWNSNAKSIVRVEDSFVKGILLDSNMIECPSWREGFRDERNLIACLRTPEAGHLAGTSVKAA